MLLKALEYYPPAELPAVFPYSVPVFADLPKVEFEASITFLVGENGSGKSTFIETLACAADSITAGSEGIHTDPTLAAVRNFSKHFKLIWTKRTRKGFFLRAEDFFGYAKQVAQMRAEMESDMAQIDRDYSSAGRSKTAKGLALMPYARELHEIKQSYGEGGLDANSHGEGFFKFFQRRFTGEGLYLMDEPEAALSPMRQLAFLRLLKESVGRGAQFVIATHSPIIMAYPGAVIWGFDGGAMRPVDYAQTEHVLITRDFINHPDIYLNSVLGDL
ncbi:MAG: AAA family ATPase [Anaerolineae bacterium]|nr:AAA family ATPase [Anaerolineae bacterium]